MRAMRKMATALCLALALVTGAGLAPTLPSMIPGMVTGMVTGMIPSMAPGWHAGAAFAAADDVTIEGNRFLRGGRPWVAEGVTLIGMVAPDREIAARASYNAARQRFGPDMLAAVRDYGADTVRYQISQGGLDPQSAIYDPAYLQQVLGAISLTRKSGLNVIVSMTWQGPSGAKNASGMPDDTTRRAWSTILPSIGSDRGILLELFNEPHLKEKTPENWATWQRDFQSLIDLVRAAGAKNVVLVDGMRSAHYLGGAPKLTDPAGQLGYAVHPYLVAINKTRRAWDENFGDFSLKHAVMATEFNARSNNGYCRTTFPQETAKLLDYLRRHEIGLVIWAFDLPGVRKPDGTLASYDNFSCEKGSGNGAGEAVHEYFLAH